MQITIDLPDNLALTESDLCREVAVSFAVPKATRSFSKTSCQQNILLIEQAAQVFAMDVNDFYQILFDRGILTLPCDPDDDPNELIFAHLRIPYNKSKKAT